MIYGLLFIAFVGYLLNLVSQKYVFTNFTYKRNIAKQVVEINEEFEITETIENKKLLPVTFLQTVAKYPGKGRMKIKLKNNSAVKPDIKNEYLYYTTTYSVMPYQRIKRIYKAFINKRGRYIFEDVVLNAGDIFGLKIFKKTLSEPTEIVAYPIPYNIEKNIVSYGDYYGDISVKRWIIDDPILTTGIREYTGHEPQKTIHWPSSLKSGRLMVKKFDFTTDNKVLILLNIECSKPFWFNIDSDNIEKCISIVRTIAEEFNNHGIQFGFGTNAQAAGCFENVSQIISGWGDIHIADILEYLGRIEYSVNCEFEKYLNRFACSNDSYTTCIIVTPKVDELYIDEINTLCQKFTKTVLISVDKDNLDNLDDHIITLVEGSDA